jgi:hypothetical protein
MPLLARTPGIMDSSTPRGRVMKNDEFFLVGHIGP